MFVHHQLFKHDKFENNENQTKSISNTQHSNIFIIPKQLVKQLPVPFDVQFTFAFRQLSAKHWIVQTNPVGQVKLHDPVHVLMH